MKVVDPEKGDQYAIIKCAHIRPEKQLLFDDVKNSIAKDYRNHHKEKLMNKVKEQLWKKYDVKIYENILSNKLELIK
ncbi:MAG: hypothetical protein U5R06_14125 [candidate division KSB1 bacterium]|nr:hypothetical protein [candidate division KSB1 bacterium]